MPIKSSLEIEIPKIDLLTLLLDGIPEPSEIVSNPVFTQPYLLSAEEPSKSLSLIQVKQYAKDFATGLQRTTFHPADHVMVVAPNYVNSIIVIIGCIAAGGVFCAAQPDLFLRDYVDQFQRDEPNFLFVQDEQPQCQIILEAWKASGRVVEGHVWLFNDDPISNDLKQQNSSVHPCGDIPLWTALLLRSPHDSFSWDSMKNSNSPDRPCMLLTTSGTSGLRKAAVYTHANLVASFCGIGYRARTDAIAAAKSGRATARPSSVMRILHTISISRAMGATLPLATILRAKNTATQVYFMCKTYVDMAPYLDHIHHLEISELAVAPFTLVRLFKENGANGIQNGRSEFPSLVRVNVVGAPSSQSNLDRVREFLIEHQSPTSVRVERSYGITEAAALVATCRVADEDIRREGYQGRLEPNIEAKVVSANDSSSSNNSEIEMSEGQVGEIWLRGPSFIQGYYKNSTATNEAFSHDGWFRSGDVGYMEGDRVFLVDRKKDILKTPDNIPPAYIEGILTEHPDIIDAGVIGIYQPSEELQLVRAYVVRRPFSNITESDIVEWMQRQSANTTHITGGVEFVDTLPRNDAGKILRRVLRDRAAEQLGQPNAQSLVVPQQLKCLN